MFLRWQLAFWLSLLLTVGDAASAQQDASPAKPYVLHAYVNLVQVPTLALTSQFKPLPGIDRTQFSITLDDGPAFHPTRMHIEGDEPLSLAVLVDASGDQDRILHELPQALANLARTSLKPHDHITLFTLDCRLMRTGLELPPDPDLIQSAVERGLNAPNLHGTKTHGACGRSLHTWDATARVLLTLADAPGRRVLLLVSTGNDHGSRYKPNALRYLAVGRSVAIFVVRDLARFQGDFGDHLAPSSDQHIYLALSAPSEDNFAELCESTGGLIVTLDKGYVEQGLEQIDTMLRERYILEFPRPNSRIGGEHRIGITVQNRKTFIVSTGVVIPLPDAALETDPTTVPSSPSPAIMGTHKPMD